MYLHKRFSYDLLTLATLVILGGGLAACGGSISLGGQPTITGQLEGWNRGAGFTLQANVLKTFTPPEVALIASAPIDAAGNFSITLPGAATVTPFLMTTRADPSQIGTDCMGDLKVEPVEYAGTGAMFSAVSGATRLSVSLSNGVAPGPNAEQVLVGFAYFDRDLTETGSLTCTTTGTGGATRQVQSSGNASFKVGWNHEIVALKNDASGQVSSLAVSTGLLPAGLKWTFR